MLGRERVELALVRDRGSNLNAGEAAAAAVIRSIAKIVTGFIEIENRLINEGSSSIAVQGDSSTARFCSYSGTARDGDVLEEKIDTMLVRPANITVSSEGRRQRGRNTGRVPVFGTGEPRHVRPDDDAVQRIGYNGRKESLGTAADRDVAGQ